MFTAQPGRELFYLVARVYFDHFVNKTARPYILFMSKAIDQSLFAFYCSKLFLFSDRSPESNKALLTHALQLSQPFHPLTTRMVITVKPPFTDTRLIRTPRYYRQFPLSLGKESPHKFSKFSPLLKYGHPLIRTMDTYFLPDQQIFVESRPPYKMICRRPFQTYFCIKQK